MKTISLILPTFNEQSNIEKLIRRIYGVLPDAEVIVVDDDSPDKTWEIAMNLAQEFSHLKVLRRINERGLMTAISAGINMAKGDAIGWLDCDLSMPPETFVTMAKHLDNADVIIGSRYVPGGKDARPFMRKAFSPMINFIGKLLLGTKSIDLTSGFILCRRNILAEFPLTGHYGEYFIALIFRAERAGYNVFEVPYIFTDRIEGKSKTNESFFGFLFLGIRYVKMIITLAKERFFNEGKSCL